MPLPPPLPPQQQQQQQQQQRARRRGGGRGAVAALALLLSCGVAGVVAAWAERWGRARDERARTRLVNVNVNVNVNAREVATATKRERLFGDDANAKRVAAWLDSNAEIDEFNATTPEDLTDAVEKNRREYLLREDSFVGTMHVTRSIAALTEQVNSTARLVNIGGWPVCAWSGVCVLRHRRGNAMVVRPSTSTDVTVVDSNLAETQTQTTMTQRTCVPIPPLLDTAAKNKVPMPRRKIRWLRGTTLIVDTFVASMHFGHVGNKVVQAHHLLRETTDDGVDQVLFLQQRRYPSFRRPEGDPLTHLVVAALSPDFVARDKSIYRNDVSNLGESLVCLERAIEVRNVFERKFAVPAEYGKWRRHVSAHAMTGAWSRDGKTPLDLPLTTCPTRVEEVLVMQRTEGNSLRPFLNYDDLEAAFDQVGVCSWGYRNVSINSTTPLRDQASLFWGFGLMLSPHSSQLINAMFAHELAAVLEVRPDLGEGNPDLLWSRLPSPFCVAFACPPVFNVTYGHYDPTTSRARAGKQPGTFLAPVFVRVGVLTQALRSLLTAQRERFERAGCALPQYLARFASGDPRGACDRRS